MLIKILIKSVCNISRSLGNNVMEQRKRLVFWNVLLILDKSTTVSSSTALV